MFNELTITTRTTKLPFYSFSSKEAKRMSDEIDAIRVKSPGYRQFIVHKIDNLLFNLITWDNKACYNSFRSSNAEIIDEFETKRRAYNKLNGFTRSLKFKYTGEDFLTRPIPKKKKIIIPIVLVVTT